MKKTLKLMLTMALVVVMVFAFAACSSAYSKVEGALEGIGYEKMESSSEANKYADEDAGVKAYGFKKVDGVQTNVVIVLEFEATEDMKEYYQNSSALQGLVKDVQEDGTAEEFHQALEDAGIAKGNCLVFSTNILAASDVANAIKKA